MSAHSEFGPSSSERWYNCTASVPLSRNVPPQESSVYAEEGTLAHECLEAIIHPYVTHHSYVKRKTEFTKEMGKYALWALRAIRDMIDAAPDAISFSEQKVDISHFTKPGQFGTLDFALAELFGTLTIADYKYGAGIPVDPEENLQLISYALAMLKKFDYNFSHVRFVILQPRADHPKGPRREWTASVDEVVAWEAKLKQKVIEAETNPVFKAGDHCRFCPAANICPEISLKAMKQAQLDFETIRDEVSIVPKKDIFTSDERGALLDAADKLEQWISAIRMDAWHRMNKGEKIPGWKLIEKRARRKWLDAEKAGVKLEEAYLTSEYYKNTLCTPAQVEELIKAELNANDRKYWLTWLERNTAKVSSGLRLAREGEDGESRSRILDDFSDIEI